MPEGSASLDFEPRHPFFIGLDSDGCVFDSMEIKHKECFTPMFIKHFKLQEVSRYAREVWEFVNLYSRTRGSNRFHALSVALDLLRVRPEVQAREVQVASSEALREWTAREKRPGNDTLTLEVEGGNAALAQALQWSRAVNAAVEDISRGVPPFPQARECLKFLAGHADAMVISQTPVATLRREWAEHKIESCVTVIAGQEMGSKAERIQLAALTKYPRAHILMIGDAAGDAKAAHVNNVAFFPILPRKEEASWDRLMQEGLPRLFAGQFSAEYEKGLLTEFEAELPLTPPWRQVASA